MNWQDFIDQKEVLESKLSVTILNIDLFLEAFTHKSYANECPELKTKHNERLEFLGDSILGLYASLRLMKIYPDVSEGELTAKRAQMVRASSCANYIRRLGLDLFFLVGKGEYATPERALESMHADLFESLLAAIYLDQGQEKAFLYLDRDVFPLMEEILHDDSSQNWKAMLQDYCQKNMKMTPTYHLLSKSGPEHDSNFQMGVFLEDKMLAKGVGKTKKDAEKSASKKAFLELENKDGN